MDRQALKVAFNATPLLSPVTGIGNYIIELGAALARGGTVDPYSFYRYRWRHEAPTPPVPPPARQLDLATRFKPFIPLRGAIRHIAHHLGFAGGLHRYRIELYHEQNYVPLSYDVPVVTTIHDLSWIRYPEAHPTDRVKWLERGLPKAIDRSQAILVDSEFIRHEVLTTFGIDTERVHTASLAAAADFMPRSAAQTTAALEPLGLAHGRYLLTVGTIEPRKNLRHILEAFAMLPTVLRERFPLVVAGAKGWHSSGLINRLRQLGDRQVRFLGHVDRSTLPHLYSGAALFAFPSLYEGFGLPPLEAMASGVPVIVSDRASLPEVVGGAGETMNPDDPADTGSRLRALLEDPATRQAMARRGLERSTMFSWERCAEVTYSVYCSVLGRGRSETTAGLRSQATVADSQGVS